MPGLSKPTPQGRLGILFAVPVLFSILFFIVNTVAERNDLQLIRLQALSSGIGKLRSFSNDAEVAVDRFLITGDRTYLLGLDKISSRMRLYVELLTHGAPADPSSDRRVKRLIELVHQRLEDANQLVALQSSEGFPAAFDEAKSGRSRETMEQIRNLVDDLQVELNSRISERLNKERYLTRWAFLVFLVGTLLMLVVLVWLYQSLLAYINSRDRAHAQLSELNMDLERRIAERTKELQLFNDELQQFAYVASHDLQEPLRTISSFTQLLQSRYKDRFDGEADEFMGYITNAARRMSDLINGLLAVVRLRKSGQSPTPVPLVDVLEEAKSSLQGAIRDSGAEIRCEDLPTLILDRLQFAQVFQNLLGNAIKYRGEAPPCILVAAKRESIQWIISVTDNGRGFQREFAERIFGMFQRLHTRDVEGTGMGLPITKKIVERHGGRIWAESAEGVGSTFFIALPISLEPRAEAHAPQDVGARQ